MMKEYKKICMECAIMYSDTQDVHKYLLFKGKCDVCGKDRPLIKVAHCTNFNFLMDTITSTGQLAPTGVGRKH